MNVTISLYIYITVIHDQDHHFDVKKERKKEDDMPLTEMVHQHFQHF